MPFDLRDIPDSKVKENNYGKDKCFRNTWMKLEQFLKRIYWNLKRRISIDPQREERLCSIGKILQAILKDK